MSFIFPTLGQYLSQRLAQNAHPDMNSAEAIDRMRQIIRRQHKALATEDA
jgi:hypothetical protein